MTRNAPDTAASTGPRIFTVPPGRPFLDCLAAAILKGDLPGSTGKAPGALELPDFTIILPTRRAARALQEAFLRASGSTAMLLPRIRPIAEAEEDLSLLVGLASRESFAGADADIAPAVSGIERQLVLTELVMRWSEAMRGAPAGGDGEIEVAAGAGTPAQAAQLAHELARLMDMVETENVSLAGLEKIVPETFSEHWEKTLQFLKIVTQFWPVHLAERGFTSPADHRNRLILSEAGRLALAPPKAPVIVAGVTGSVPATAELMRAVAGLAQGAIVLPALDQTLDEASWLRIAPDRPGADMPGHPEHPQFGLAKLLARLGVERKAVRVLPGAAPTPPIAARTGLMSEAMRPSGTTQNWHEVAAGADKSAIRAALKGVGYLAVPTAQDEAEVIALILREAVETPGRTAALVSPDRMLARRVANRLDAWGIRVDDSAGRPFPKTVPGAFLDLTIAAIAEHFAPQSLMALLKHPLCRLGLPVATIRRAARALELAAFRTAYLGRGLDGVEAALERAAREVAARERRVRAVNRLWEADWAAARDLVQRLTTAFAPLSALFAQAGPQTLAALAQAHIDTAEALARLPDETERSALWADEEAGEAASLFFASILDETMPAPQLHSRDYPDFYRSLVARENVRPRVPVHPRLSIWGPFEARLQQPDVVILGSLNDGTWPESADPGPWLNRPMRGELGLPSPEERIGYAAHDFTALLGAETVYLTRAQKIDGVPTVPSRWIMRLEALLAGMGLADALQSDRSWIGWARSRDAIPPRRSIGPPEPRPPSKLRPRRVTVSKVETWIANPYAIFAADILGLERLPDLGQEPDASLRGGIIHAALGRFSTRHPTSLPADPKAELMDIAAEVMAEYKAHPRVAAFWLPRFERFAGWFAATEASRREGVVQTMAEIAGEMLIEAAGGPFTLRARADRIDLTAAGLVVTDYKTGTPPSDRSVLAGFSPQLPLEAAIAAAGGFTGIEAGKTAALKYIRASGGEPPGEERTIKSDDVMGLAGAAMDGLKRLIAEFDDPKTPYRAVRRSRFSYDYDDYAHLARVAEWSAGGDGEG